MVVERAARPSSRGRDRRAETARRILTALAYAGAWLVCSLAVTAVLFFSSSRSIELASHDAVKSGTADPLRVESFRRLLAARSEPAY